MRGSTNQNPHNSASHHRPRAVRDSPCTLLALVHGLILTAAVLPDADPRSLDAGVKHALTIHPTWSSCKPAC
ncbi:MAG: hypothetical protein U1F77_17200 [Kiritimatiellia bacterium]